MTEITNEQAEKELNERSAAVSEADVGRILENQDEIEKKFSSEGPLKKFFNDITLLLPMMHDYWSGEYREIPWTTIAASVAALAYVLSPVDLIPDFIPVIGYIDDAAVVALCLSAIQSDLEKYTCWKNAEKIMD